MANGTLSDDTLFSSLISDIKSYTGRDPLLPWLRGIRRMKDSLPPQLLREKLPRFLQKCAQTFETDRRYKNDLRYLRVWLQLMDFVNDPGSILRTMEANNIGRKKSLFYQAYALYYEKIKKFEEAEKMYHWGVNNLAEPISDLQSSFEQFLKRMERHEKKRNQRQGGKITNAYVKCDENKENSETCITGSSSQPNFESRSYVKTQDKKADLNEKRNACGGDDTVVVKFVDTAIVGRSLSEDVCHHGLVEPTINTKEAMDAINNMFREPLEPSHIGKRSIKTEPKSCSMLKSGFEVFTDEVLDNKGLETHQPPQGSSLQILIDDEENKEAKGSSENGNVNAFVFPNPKDLPSEEKARPREDTVVFRFVGSTISDEPVVENVCHHGLVEPTVNLKEAMDDINGMFGKPIEFTRKNRPKRQEREPERKKEMGGFLILPDNESSHQSHNLQSKSSHQPQKLQPKSSLPSRKDMDLFEPTMCTKEAMDEINKLFGMPLDF